MVDVLKKEPRGIPENQDLFDCYRGIEKDIQQLKVQGYIRYIYNAEKDKKFNVLFYKNPDDTAENLSTPVSPFVKDLWKNLLITDVQVRQRIIEELRKKN